MNKIKETLIHKKISLKPIWFMRQAGRYLPEFRAIRKNNKDFIKLCLNSKISSEITMQPLKRFKLDAAIIFSDILIIPFALGQKVSFNKSGPVLGNTNNILKNNLDGEKFKSKLEPVYENIRITKPKLDKKISLIGFVGAPWTLATYMLKLKKIDNNLDIDKFKNLDEIEELIKKLTLAIKVHIKNQFNSGIDVLQIFDSWSGIIPNSYLKKFCFEPNKELVKYCKDLGLPVICFTKGIGKNLKHFNDFVQPSGISIDQKVDPIWARDNLKDTCIQGGLDPELLLGDEKKLIKEVDKFLDIFDKEPYIFNLGHGILPGTNPNIISKIVDRINKNG